jgi:hypothetical protein
MEVVRVCDLRLRPVLIQGFGWCPPRTTQIVGWIVGGDQSRLPADPELRVAPTDQPLRDVEIAVRVCGQ